MITLDQVKIILKEAPVGKDGKILPNKKDSQRDKELTKKNIQKYSNKQPELFDTSKVGKEDPIKDVKNVSDITGGKRAGIRGKKPVLPGSTPKAKKLKVIQPTIGVNQAEVSKKAKEFTDKVNKAGFDKANKEIFDVTGKSAVRDAKKYSKGEYPKVGGGGLKPDIKKPNKGTTPVKVNVKKPINVDKIFSGAGNVKKGDIVPDKNISPKSKGTTPVKVNVKKSINVNKIFDKPKSPIKKTIGVKQSEVSKQAKEFTAKINKANVKVQKNYVGRKAVRIKNATLGKKTGSLRKGTLSFPGDRSGAYQATKSDIQARQGFKDLRPGGLKADERNPFVKRSVRKGRVDDLGGDIYDQPKFDQKKFEKSLQQTKKSKTFKIPPDPHKRFSKISKEIKDLNRTSSVKSKVKPKKIITNFAKDQKGELALTPKQIERQRLTKDLRDRVAKRRNVATNMQANINKLSTTDKDTPAVKALKALNRKTRNMARASETGKVFAPVKYDAAYAKKSLARLGIGGGSKGGSRTNQDANREFNRQRRVIKKKYRSSATKNIQKNVSKNLLKGFGKKSLRYLGKNAVPAALLSLYGYDLYQSNKAQKQFQSSQSGPRELNLKKDTSIIPIRLKGGKSISSIPKKDRTDTDKELLNFGKSLSNKAFQQMKPGGRYENEKVYNYFKNNQNYKNRLRKLSQQQGKTVNPYGVDLSVKK